MHLWPVWGNDRVVEMLKLGRDAYRYINDQTLRLANEGYGPNELADKITFPEPLNKFWAFRSYYGTLYHNAKGTYVKYLGWFDGNPANLHVLPPVAAAKKYVEYMGGPAAVLKRAQADYAKGAYQWVAEVTSRVVFADPQNRAARELEADALEQMGYQAESGPWRNFYLSGAKELREGVNKLAIGRSSNPDVLRVLPLDMFFDYLGVRLNGPKAAGKQFVLNMQFPDLKENDVLMLENGALSHTMQATAANADATVTLDRATFVGVVFGKKTLEQALADKSIVIEGNQEALGTLLSLFDTFDPWFNLVTPRAE